MIPDDKKLKRLAMVAQMYYEQEMNQSLIAQKIGVSRPMISKLLSEAKEYGVVTIKINQMMNAQQIIAQKLVQKFALIEAVVVKSDKKTSLTNQKIAQAGFELCMSDACSNMKLGIGWGSMLGRMIDYVEALNSVPQSKGEVFPLIGGIRASYRSYHTNELVRIFSDKTGLSADYFYMPAIFESETEKKLYQSTDGFRDISEKWKSMDTAIINISNYPTSPDLATAHRFGNKLSMTKATGSFLAHYYNKEGCFVEEQNDIIMQISATLLKSAKRVIALCACTVNPESVLGALRTGIITHIVISDDLCDQIMQLCDSTSNDVS